MAGESKQGATYGVEGSSRVCQEVGGAPHLEPVLAASLHEAGPLPHTVISRHPARHPLVCRRSRGNAIEARPENGLGICLVTYLLSEALTGFMPMPLRMCVLRLEVLHMDLIHLHAVLCRWFRFCERLPAIPEIIPTGLRP